MRKRGTFAESAHKAFWLVTVCGVPAQLVKFSKYSEFTRFRFGVAVVVAAGVGLIFTGLHFIASARKVKSRASGEGLESSAKSAGFSDVGESQ